MRTFEEFIKENDPHFQCRGCDVNVLVTGEYAFKLNDDVWDKINGPRGDGPKQMMCVDCIEKHLGRKLARDDFDWENEINDQNAKRSNTLQKRMRV